MRKTFPPDVEAWLEETLSRQKPLTVEQLDAIKPAFRRAARSELPETQAA